MADVFRIDILSQTGVFYPGQAVNARLVASLREPIKARGIIVYVSGRASTYWTESRGEDTYDYSAKIIYLNLQIAVWLPTESKCVPPGKHEFPFHFTIPLSCPPSYEGLYGCIRYYARAKIDRPWKVDDTTATVFTVMPVFDLNTVPYATASIGRHFSKMITTCCCCENGRIYVDVNLSKCALVPGETVVARTSVKNGSSKHIYEIELALMETSRNMGKRYQTDRNAIMRTHCRLIRKFCHKFRVNPRSSSSHQMSFVIPSVVPSFNMCPIIQVDYSLYARIKIDSVFTSDVRCGVPMLIGNIPAEVCDNAVDAPFNLVPPTATAPYPDDDDKYAGQFTLTGSALGGGNIGNGVDDGNIGYAPKYMVYDNLQPRENASAIHEASSQQEPQPVDGGAIGWNV